MTFGKRVKTWIVDHPFHIVRYVLCLLFIGLGISRWQAIGDAGIQGPADAGAGLAVFGLFFLAVACIIPDIIKPISGGISYLITRLVYPESKAQKMSNDPRLADYYLENERYEESLHEFERLHHDYPEDYYVLSRIVLLQGILEDEDEREKYAEKLSRLPEPVVEEPESEEENVEDVEMREEQKENP